MVDKASSRTSREPGPSYTDDQKGVSESIRTSRCIPFREVPEVYHMFMDILHCFIFSKVFILIGGVPLDLVYVDAVIILSSSKESIR